MKNQHNLRHFGLLALVSLSLLPSAGLAQVDDTDYYPYVPLPAGFRKGVNMGGAYGNTAYPWVINPLARWTADSSKTVGL